MLCFPGLLNGFVFPEAPTDARLDFNRSPGENQGDGADPSFDGNRTSGTKSLAVAARGNRRDLCWPDLPFELYTLNKAFLPKLFLCLAVPVLSTSTSGWCHHP